ncbi:DUF397 domain-containing protein [Micromonospora sp. ATA32]|jgi:hypothetical protein|nr:DUF397 domain-containing protein [Micromonospora sp. ATA32]
MTRLDLAGARWCTSTRSIGNGNCVEVAAAGGRIAVRDSKDRLGPVLAFPPSAWVAFLAALDRVRPD